MPRPRKSPAEVRAARIRAARARWDVRTPPERLKELEPALAAMAERRENARGTKKVEG